MDISKALQGWRLGHPLLKKIATVVGILSTFIGLGGIGDDLKGWSGFLYQIYEYIISIHLPSFPQDWGRWLFVIAGMIMMFVANDIPGKLASRFRPSKMPTPLPSDHALVLTSSSSAVELYDNRSKAPSLNVLFGSCKSIWCLFLTGQ